MAPTGHQYRLAGNASRFTIIELPPNSNTTITYNIVDSGVWVTAKTTITHVETSDAYFGEHETIHTELFGFDQRTTFRFLIGVVKGTLSV
jgi:hypothetical protein